MLADKLRSATAGERLYVDDVFSTWLYTGTGTAPAYNITNGIDLAGKGGLVWIKGRNYAGDRHILVDSVRGATKTIASNLTDAEVTYANSISGFLNNGFTIGDGVSSNVFVNRVSTNFSSWTFRNADKFFNHAVVTKSAGSNATVSFANLGTLGMVRVKRTDAAGSWYIWHRGLSAGQLLIGETTAAAATLGHVTVSGTTVTLVNGVIADGTYLVEAFAHDTASDGLIQCGSNVAGGNNLIDLGWEPQFVLFKRVDVAEDWRIIDSMRGFTVDQNSPHLIPNTSGAEVVSNWALIRNTGFTINSGAGTYIYLAIRRPNKPPTSGTGVLHINAGVQSGTSQITTGFPVDMVLAPGRSSGNNRVIFDRLRGIDTNGSISARQLSTHLTDAEGTVTAGNSYANTHTNTGYRVAMNLDGLNWVLYSFRRAPGFFDVVCYTGTGANRTVAHNLGAVPELMIVKSRSAAGSYWPVYSASLLNTEHVQLQSGSGKNTFAPYWNSTSPTASVFTVGTAGDTNGSGANLVAYLFASLPGISKVGSYTGNGGTVNTNGTSQTVNCGFSAGARFVLIKRTDSTGDWFVFDTARGIVAGNDPYLFLNSTAAETTTVDAVDTDSTGFVVNQTSGTNLNVTGASYIFLSIA